MKYKSEGKMIAFRVQANITQAKLNKFCREFYGYLDRSNKGKYAYKRKGFLDKFLHINPIRSLLIVRDEDCQKIVSFLEDYNAEIFVRSIILEAEDMKKLRIKKQGGGSNDTDH